MKSVRAPCFGQSSEDIESWLRAHIQVGAHVAIRNTQGGLLHYIPATVVRLGRGRFEVLPEMNHSLGTGGNSFYYSGKNCWHPKGQTRLVIPTDEVRAAYGPPGSLGISYGTLSV